MKKDQNHVRILYIFKNEELEKAVERFLKNKEEFPMTEKRVCNLGAMRNTACSWEPDVIVFSAKVRPGQICLFAEWFREEPFPQRPHMFSLFKIPKKTSRKLRKMYKQYIAKFVKDSTLTTNITKFLRTIK